MRQNLYAWLFEGGIIGVPKRLMGLMEPLGMDFDILGKVMYLLYCGEDGINVNDQYALTAVKTLQNKGFINWYSDLRKVEDDNVRNLNMIINSYKFRLIQLCKSHLRDNYITEADFEQITEMYKLYHGLGGNGQAQEYYERVLKLEIKPDEE